MNVMQRMGVLRPRKVHTNIKKKFYVILDSGESEHIVSKMEYRPKIQQEPKITAKLANRYVVSLTHRGLVDIGVGGTMSLSCNAYHISDLNLNSLSCSQLDDYRFTTRTTQGRCILMNRDDNYRQIGVVKKSSDGLLTEQIIIL